MRSLLRVFPELLLPDAATDAELDALAGSKDLQAFMQLLNRLNDTLTPERLVYGAADGSEAQDARLSFDPATGTLSVPALMQAPTAPFTLYAGSERALYFTGSSVYTRSFFAAGAGNAANSDENVGMLSGALANVTPALSAGRGNFAFGRDALGLLTTGQENVAMGYAAAYGQIAGIGNLAIGTGALGNMPGGDTNIGIGYAAGSTLDGAPQNCIMIGAFADAFTAPLDAANRIAIGFAVDADTDNQAFFGNSDVSAWVPGADGLCDLGRADRGMRDLYFDGVLRHAGLSTGAAGATWAAANKPGLARAQVDGWLEVYSGGTRGWVPWFRHT